MKTIPLVLVLLLSGSALAEDLVLKDGRTLKDVKIVSHTLEHLIVMHGGKIENVALADCPKDVQANYGYDPEKIAQAAQDKEAKLMKAELAKYRQQQRLENLLEERASDTKPEPKPKAETVRKWRIVGKVLSVTESGVLVSPSGSASYTTKEIWPPDPPKKLLSSYNDPHLGERKRYEKEKEAWEEHVWQHRKELVNELVFLSNHPLQQALVDDSRVDVYASPAGTYSYKAVSGALKTVNKFNYMSVTPFL